MKADSMNTHIVDLNQPLPYPSKMRWGYQHYPVFSASWWRGRTIVFGLGVLTLTAITGAGAIFDFTDKEAAILTTIKFCIGIAGMALTGSTIATLVRTQIKPSRLQQTLIVIALLIGVGAASLFDAWSSKAIEQGFSEYSTQRELIKQSNEINLENIPLAISNALFVSALYFWLAGGIAFIRYWREPGQMQAYFARQELSSAKAEKHQAEAKLSMLQAQIEPHFLFNSLASVKSVLREEPQLAEATIDNLVDYLRASIPRLDRNENLRNVSIKQQVALCGKYLSIMKLRLGERLSFSQEVEPSIADTAFPPLIIISLVENAIKHGIEPSADGGSIDIKVHLENNDLVITVTDDGLGLNQLANNGLSSGVGLANIRAQLDVLYGDGAQLELSERQQGGVQASIVIKNFINAS